MAQHVQYVGKPFYLGEYDKEIFQGHRFAVIFHPMTHSDTGDSIACTFAPHIHVRSITYPQITTELFDGEYRTA